MFFRLLVQTALRGFQVSWNMKNQKEKHCLSTDILGPSLYKYVGSVCIVEIQQIVYTGRLEKDTKKKRLGE